jgi:hypothetical protein
MELFVLSTVQQRCPAVSLIYGRDFKEQEKAILESCHAIRLTQFWSSKLVCFYA